MKLCFKMNDTDLNTLFNGNVFSRKITNTRIIIYFVNDTPLIIDSPSGLIPTLYTVWKFPSIVRKIETMLGAPSFVLKGADLMLAGVLPPPLSEIDEDCLVNTVYAVYCHRNPKAFAIMLGRYTGREMLTSWKGKAFETWNYFGDNLWSMGPKSIFEGFSISNINPVLPLLVEESDELKKEIGKLVLTTSENNPSTINKDCSFSLMENKDQNNKLEKESESELESEEESEDIDDDIFNAFDSDTAACSNVVKVKKDENKTKTIKLKTEKIKKLKSEKNNEIEEVCHNSSTKEAEQIGSDNETTNTNSDIKYNPNDFLNGVLMDDYFFYSFLEFLSKTEIVETPMNLSALVSKVIPFSFGASTHSLLRSSWKENGFLRLPGRLDAAPPKLDAKKSSHKKVGKIFSNHLPLASIVRTKTVRNEEIVTSIDRHHPLVRSYVPIKKGDLRLLPNDTKTHLGTVTSSGVSVACDDANVDGFSTIVRVMYKPIKPSEAIFSTFSSKNLDDEEELFTKSEVVAIANAFIVKSNEAATEKDNFEISKTYWRLPELLSTKDKKTILKAEWNEYFKSKMTTSLFCIFQVPKSEVLISEDSIPTPPTTIWQKGTVPNIKINEVKKRGHYVTILQNLSDFMIDFKDCSSYLSNKLACSCSVVMFEGDSCIQLQGNQSESVMNAIIKYYGINKQYISIIHK